MSGDHDGVVKNDEKQEEKQEEAFDFFKDHEKGSCKPFMTKKISDNLVKYITDGLKQLQNNE